MGSFGEFWKNIISATINHFSVFRQKKLPIFQFIYAIVPIFLREGIFKASTKHTKLRENVIQFVLIGDLPGDLPGDLTQVVKAEVRIDGRCSLQMRLVVALFNVLAIACNVVKLFSGISFRACLLFQTYRAVYWTIMFLFCRARETRTCKGFRKANPALFPAARS